MNSLLKKIKDNSFFEMLMHSKNYFIGMIATKAMAFISIPVMTRILTPEEYGIVNVFNSYVLVLSVVFTLNSFVALGRYYFEGKDDLNEFFGTLIIFNSVTLFGIFFLIKFSSSWLSSFLRIPIETLIFIIPFVFFYIFSSWYEQLYIPLKKSKQIAFRSSLEAYLVFFISIGIIFLLKEKKYLGPIYSKCAIGVAFLIYYIKVLKKFIKITFKLDAIKYSLHYALPLLPYSLSGIILAQFDRIMVGKYSGSENAGLYSFAYNIGMLLTIVIASLNKAWMPDFYELMNKKDQDTINKNIRRMFKVILICALFLILFAREIGIVLASEKFHSSLHIIPIIVIGYVFYAIVPFFLWNIEYYKKNIYTSIITIISSIVNIVLNAIFIPKFGYVAAAYTTVFSYLLLALLGWLVSILILKVKTVSLLFFVIQLLLFSFFVFIYYLIDLSQINYLLKIIFKLFWGAMFSLFLFKPLKRN